MNQEVDLEEEFRFCNAVEEFCSLSIHEPFFLEGLEQEFKRLASVFTYVQSVLRFQHAVLTSTAAAAAAAGYCAITKRKINNVASVTLDAIEAKRIVDKFIVVNTTHQRTKKKKKDRYFFNKIVYLFNSWKATDKVMAIKKLQSINTSRFFIHDDRDHEWICSHARGNPSSSDIYDDVLMAGDYRLMGREDDNVDRDHEWICSHEREKTSSDFSYGDDVLVGGEDADDDDRDGNMKVILEKLMMSGAKENDHHERELRVVSIVGMPGIGKTTLSRMIYNSDPIRSHFGFRAWVSYDVDEIINMIDWPYPCPQNPFWKQRYLIVIDDFVTLHKWNVAKGFLLTRNMFNGSRILLNTRNESLALNAMVGGTCPTPYLLRPLKDVQSWKLFNKKVRPNPLPLDLESIGKEIVKKCHGLPIAIEHLANHLSNKKGDYSEWLEVLDSANKQPAAGNDYQLTPWSYLVEIIVRNLPLNLKRCLFYLGLFPKNSTISVRRLIALWLAEGFVEPEGDRNLEYIAESYLHELMDLNLIQVAKRMSNGKPKRCCLVHYLHEHLLITRLKQANCNGIRRIANHHLEDGIDMSSPESYKSLVSFLSFDYREGFAPGQQIKNFLYGGISKGCFQLLRVLDLEGVYKPGLPKELGKLIHLRYLGLRWTYLDTLPTFIDNFINLQTLDVKHTYINNVPNSIWKLQKLRHLYLNESYLDSFVHQPSVGYMDLNSSSDSEDGKSLTRNLQTLSGIFVDEESSVKEGLDRFTKITRLGVSCYLVSTSQQDAMANWISKLHNLRSLRLRSKDRLGKLSVIKLLSFWNHRYLYELNLLGQLEKIFKANEFPPNLTELTLSASKLEEDPMPILGLLSNLSILKLHSDTYTGEHMVCKSFGFKKLKVLEIWKLKNLEVWSVEEGTMRVLEKLEIRFCENLEMLPVGLQQITTLQELKLTDMSNRFNQKVKQDDDKDWYKRAGVQFVYWDTLSSNVAQPSSSPSCSCFGNLLLLFLLLHGRVPSSTTKHARVIGVPALTFRRRG